MPSKKRKDRRKKKSTPEKPITPYGETSTIPNCQTSSTNPSTGMGINPRVHTHINAKSRNPPRGHSGGGLFCYHISRGKSLLKQWRNVISLSSLVQAVILRTRWLKKTSMVFWNCCSLPVPQCRQKHLSRCFQGRWFLTYSLFMDQLTQFRIYLSLTLFYLP